MMEAASGGEERRRGEDEALQGGWKGEEGLAEVVGIKGRRSLCEGTRETVGRLSVAGGS